MIAQLKGYAWQLAAAALGALLVVQSLRLAAESTAHAKTAKAWSDDRSAADSAARELSERYRTLENDHRAQITQIGAEASAALGVATADAGRARAAGERLQRELADYLIAHRAAAQARAAAGQCAPDTGAVDVLADLFRRADARAGELAAVADDARIRGGACERANDSADAMSDAAHP